MDDWTFFNALKSTPILFISFFKIKTSTTQLVANSQTNDTTTHRVRAEIGRSCVFSCNTHALPPIETLAYDVLSVYVFQSRLIKQIAEYLAI